MVVGQYNSLVKSSVGSGRGLVYYDESRPPDFVKEFKGKALYEVAKCIKSWNLTEEKNIKVIIDNEEVEFNKKDVALIRLAIKF